MVGLCGVLGGDVPLDDLVSGLYYWGGESNVRFEDATVSVGKVTHRAESADAPASSTEGEVRLWVWGEIYSFQKNGQYVSRTAAYPEASSSELCARLYEQYGREFVSKLNGEFAGVLYDPERSEAMLFTDRFASRALYWTPTDEGVVFSAQIQSLAEFAFTEPRFDETYLAEYLTYKRSFGVRTPVRGVEKLPPATTLTVDLSTHETTCEQYWTPEFDPVERSFDAVVDEFTELFRTVMDERTADDLEYGVLLSGGSDSRLMLANLDDCTTFHMADWENREAQIARRVAEQTDNEFTLLQRDPEYQHRALNENPRIGNFSGWFNQAHAAGFQETLRENADVVLAGQFADTFFKGFAIPTRSLSLGNIGTPKLPLQKHIRTIDEYVDHHAASLPPYLDISESGADLLQANIDRDDDHVRHHGVAYDSLETMAVTDQVYPLTNQPDYFWHDSLVQMMPYRNPFIDNRLAEFYLSVPTKFQIRRNMVNQAVARAAPELAAIPHGTSGLSLSRPQVAHHVAELLTRLRWKYNLYLPGNEPPDAHTDHLPWTRHGELIRRDPFLIDAIRENQELVEACPILDWDGVMDCYEAHKRGENRRSELYLLATFLQMPLTQAVYGDAAPGNRTAATDAESHETP